MKRIAYAEQWLTTDDRVADLVLEYARALGRQETADTVTIPVLDGGAVRHAQLLIGPASQIIVVEVDDERPQRLVADAEAAIVELQSRVEQLRSPHPVATEREDDLPGQLPED